MGQCKLANKLLKAGDAGLKATLLWTNQNPSAAFDTQAITLSDDLKNYDYYMMVTRDYYTSAVYNQSIYPISNLSHAVLYNHIMGWNEPYWYVRAVFSYVQATKSISFDNAYMFTGTTTHSIDNYGAIPYKIYGVKGVISGI